MGFFRCQVEEYGELDPPTSYGYRCPSSFAKIGRSLSSLKIGPPDFSRVPRDTFNAGAPSNLFYRVKHPAKDPLEGGIKQGDTPQDKADRAPDPSGQIPPPGKAAETQDSCWTFRGAGSSPLV
jgi:hypothetical protein